MKPVALGFVVAISLFAGSVSAEEMAPNIVACKPIKTAVQLQAIGANAKTLKGTYCLANDIDASLIADFVPIGRFTSYFSGNLYGNGHVIRNLTINDSTDQYAGLFGVVGGGTIQDLGIENIKLVHTYSSAQAVSGGAAGFIAGLSSTTPARISNVYTTGVMKCTGSACFNGGIVGEMQSNCSLNDSWSSVNLVANGGSGGAIGATGDPSAVVSRVYATGSVTCTAAACEAAGGLAAAISTGTVLNSFATGPVTVGDNVLAGGLVGSGSVETISRSFATGPVRGSNGSTLGGLVGDEFGGTLDQVYSASVITGGAGATLGGLIGKIDSGSPTVTVTNAYWDGDTTGQPTSAGGFGAFRTTTQLRAGLPAGFDSTWGITASLSYPFLNDSSQFASPLATLVPSNNVFTFVPIRQSDKSQYLGDPLHSDQASLATVYTMITRGVGNADNVAALSNMKIDKYYWHDSTQTTTFKGPLLTHVTLGKMTAIPAGTHLNGTNVLGQMNSHNLVILRGSYTKSGGGTATHYMLGTLYTKVGTTIHVVADDPWTGAQVEIDPAKKHVLTQNFPLSNFTVDGYQAVAGIH